MKASTASAADCAISTDWVKKSSLRLSCRSAIAPAQADSSRIGPNCAAVRRPIASPLPVRCSTSRVSATLVSQLPVFDTSWP
jgi:hypothetical protein